MEKMYVPPRVELRTVVLKEGIAAIQSAVGQVELEDWDTVQTPSKGDVSLPLW
jgi:hypothetical protein